MSKKYALGLIIACIVAAILLVQPASTQTDPADCIQLYVNGDLVYESTACTAPTPTPQPTATDEPEPTNTPTPTSEPTATPVGNGQPDPDDPACTEHDDRSWHPLHNAAEDCHYSHAHGMPRPAWVSDVFGPDVADIMWTVSYEWETPRENELKHAGYVMHAYDFQGEPCGGNKYERSVDAYIAQTHGVGIEAGKLARVHSFALSASLCDQSGHAGTVFTAGHEDYGQLISPYKKNFVSYPAFPEQLYDIGLPPYVGEGDPDSDAQKETWNSANRRATRPHVTEHEVAAIAFRIRRAVDFVDPETRLTGDPVFVPFGNADSNSSAYQLYQVEVHVPDLHGDGSPVTGTFWTDVHGNLRDDCSAPAENCVPLILVDAKPGSYQLNATAVGFIESTHKADSYFNHDLCFLSDGTVAPCSESGAETSGWIDLSGFGVE